MDNSFRTSHFKDYKLLPIYQVLSAEGIGEWPILQGTSWNRSEFNLERLLGQLFTHQVQSIFEVYVTQDEVEPTKYLLQVIFYYHDHCIVLLSHPLKGKRMKLSNKKNSRLLSSSSSYNLYWDLDRGESEFLSAVQWDIFL